MTLSWPVGIIYICLKQPKLVNEINYTLRKCEISWLLYPEVLSYGVCYNNTNPAESTVTFFYLRMMKIGAYRDENTNLLF